MVVVVGQADSNLSVYNTAGPFSDRDPSYITAAWGRDDVYANRVPSRVAVGDDEIYVVTVGGITTHYRNVLLRFNTQYSLFTRYDVENEYDANDVSFAYITIYKNVQYVQSYSGSCSSGWVKLPSIEHFHVT